MISRLLSNDDEDDDRVIIQLENFIYCTKKGTFETYYNNYFK